jgi:hypothetical protein
MYGDYCHIAGLAASGLIVVRGFVCIRSHANRIGSGTPNLLQRITENERRQAEYKAECLRESRELLYQDHLRREFTPKEPKPALPSTRVNVGAGRPRRARRVHQISRSPAAAFDDPAPEPIQLLNFDRLDFNLDSLIQIARYRGWHLCLCAHGDIGLLSSSRSAEMAEPTPANSVPRCPRSPNNGLTSGSGRPTRSRARSVREWLIRAVHPDHSFKRRNPWAHTPSFAGEFE